MATLPDRRLKMRSMTIDDVPALHVMSQAEQWPHRKQDLTAMLDLGNGMVAEMGGEVMASVMWWTCGESIATLGMLLVAKRFRGAGIGRLVAEAALDQIGQRSILLLATESGLPLARKLGFRGVSEVRQHQGTSFTAPLIPLPAGERIRPMGRSDIEPISALAQNATGLDRPTLMSTLFEKGHGIVLDRQGEVEGFAFFRRFGRGYVIGPVVAEDIPRAKALVAQWLGTRSGEFMRIDVMGDCALHEWLEELGLVGVDRFVTMVRGDEPEATLCGRSFAIASQALF